MHTALIRATGSVGDTCTPSMKVTKISAPKNGIENRLMTIAAGTSRAESIWVQACQTLRPSTKTPNVQPVSQIDMNSPVIFSS